MNIDVSSLENFGGKVLRENAFFSASAVLNRRDPFTEARTYVLMAYLFAHCSKWQSRRVSYLMDEFVPSLSPKLEADLRGKEQAMYMKFADRDGVAKTIRRLERLDETI